MVTKPIFPPLFFSLLSIQNQDFWSSMLCPSELKADYSLEFQDKPSLPTSEKGLLLDDEGMLKT